VQEQDSAVPLTDLNRTELFAYRPDVAEPDDFDQFWRSTLASADMIGLDAGFEPVDNGLRQVETFDVTFSGHGGDEVSGWLHLPIGPDGPLPAVVQFQGYSGGRGLPHENNLWALAGYAHLVVDTRGQGWGRTVGTTPDPISSRPSAPGLMTKGILDPATYYYRRVYVDAVRAVAAVRSHPRVDGTRLAVVGGSQGGALSVVAGALAPGVSAVMADVPFLCHFRRATDIATAGPYLEIAQYLASHRDDVDKVFATLGYFDAANLAKRATAPALFSIALMDQTCPPSTCMAAYRLYGGPTDLRLYEFNDHEGGEAFQQREQLRWLHARL
jgi:cephalosporin-C deacetylase